MKKITLIITLFAAVYALAGCNLLEQTTCPPRTSYTYFWSNQSSHTISIALSSSHLEYRDSLILQPRDVLNVASGWGDPIYVGLDYRMVYYDSRYRIKMSDMPPSRQPRLVSSYQYEAELRHYTFTFTDNDYQHAVENGIDLGQKE